LLKEHLLACFLDNEIEVQSSLFHAMYFIAIGGFLSINQGELCRVSLSMARVSAT
jgi:hypothetical protein